MESDHTPDGAHRHRWAVVDFFVDGDRPMMRQACTCGLERAIPAWDRSWSPPAPGRPDQGSA
jgi:hypothetical protein